MSADPSQTQPADKETGLPLASTWPRVYAVVLGFFALCVAFLIWLTRVYS
jgi:hypothetical protein